MNHLIAIDPIGGGEYIVSNIDTDEGIVLDEEGVDTILSPIQQELWTEGADMFAVPADMMQQVLQMEVV